MQRLIALSVTAWLTFLLCSCTGSSVPDGFFDPDGDDLPELEWDLITDPWSTVAAEDVDGQMTEIDDALEAKAPSALPAGYQGIQGMHFTPLTPPGGGFSGQLSVRVTMGNPIPDEYNGVRLFLFYIDPVTHEATVMDSERGRAGNWVTFDLTALGFFVIAENLAIPRPGTVFTVSAFADLAQTTAGTLINFWAIPNNGSAPYSYEWNFGDGSTAAGAQVTHAYNQPGTYNVTVLGTDALGNTAPAASTPIEITASPNPLTGLAIAVTPEPGNHLGFNYSATITGGTAPFEYAWDFDGDGTTDSTAAPPVAYDFATEGLYGGTLTVTDALGNSLSADFVSDARLLVLETNDTLGYEPYDVSFTLTALGFAPGDALEVVFGDGASNAAPGTTVPHTYLTPGTFNAFATGTSTLDGTDYPLQSAIVSIVVNERPRPAIQLTQPIVPQGVATFTIHGYNFGGAQGTSTVTFAGEPLTVDSWSDTQITVRSPGAAAAPFGELALATELAAAPPVNLTLNALNTPMAVQNVLPREIAPGEVLLVIGHGFGTTGELTLGGGSCAILHWDDNGIVATAPTGPTAGSTLIVSRPPLVASFDVSVGSEEVHPVVTSATPQPYELGTGAVTLAGTDFGGGSGGLVYIAGRVIATSSWSDTTAVLIDPPVPVDGQAVLLNRLLPSLPFGLTMIYRPQIVTVLPPFAAIGETVLISGLNFADQQSGDRVTLGGHELLVLSWTDTEITVEITDGSDDGDLVVEKKLNSNAVPFTVVPKAPGPPGGGQT